MSRCGWGARPSTCPRPRRTRPGDGASWPRGGHAAPPRARSAAPAAVHRPAFGEEVAVRAEVAPARVLVESFRRRALSACSSGAICARWRCVDRFWLAIRHARRSDRPRRSRSMQTARRLRGGLRLFRRRAGRTSAATYCNGASALRRLSAGSAGTPHIGLTKCGRVLVHGRVPPRAISLS